MFGASPDEKAYFAPFAAFLACLALGAAVAHLFEGHAAWPLTAPRYWVDPLQTVVSGGLLAWGWRRYRLRFPTHPLLGVAAGVLVLGLWIAPRWLGAAPRLEGFEPGFFGSGAAYWPNLLVRFARLVIVVPLAEEIFWRGFLARYLVQPDFLSVPVGTFTRFSFLVTTIGFGLEHDLPDWPAAFVTGVLYNLVAWRSRSLSTCVLAHAVTNLLLGLYVLRTHEWGYW